MVLWCLLIFYLFFIVIYFCYLFLTDTLLSNYAVASNLYCIGKDRDMIKDLFRNDFRALTEWIFGNYMVLNQKESSYVHW